MQYKVFKNEKGEVLLDAVLGKNKAYLLNLTKSLKDGLEEWLHDELAIEDYNLLVLADSSVKQDALTKVSERLENPTITKCGWEQVKLFLENSLEM
jgi:hypothetical protein